MLIHNFLEKELREETIHGGEGKCRHTVVFTEQEMEAPIRFINYTIIPPSASFGLHKHGNDNEFYVILSSEGVYQEDGAEVRVKKGDIIMNAPFGEHGIKNTGDTDMEVLVFEVFKEENVLHDTQGFIPAKIDDVLTNPYMGWVPLATNTEYEQPHSMVYAALLWSDLEPDAKGEYDWEGFEKRNNFEHWKSMGVKINIRFYMDLPTSVSHMDIPQWLYDAIGEDKGDFYECCVGKGFSPNYSDELLIAEHERVIAALAKRYNNNPDIAFIQLGSLGHWGEWHCWPYAEEESGPSGAFPGLSVSDRFVSHYVKYFSADKLTMRRPTWMGKDNGMGLFNDMFGEVPSTEAKDWGWLWWINNGYEDDLGQLQPAMPDFWKKNVSGGEFANGNAALYLTDDTISETIRLAKVSHSSWMGPCCPASLEYNGIYQKHIDALAKNMGYRFVIESVAHEEKVLAGTTLSVNMTWQNEGVAPFYFNWPIAVGLADENSVVTYNTVTEDIREWLPGSYEVKAEHVIPENISEGEYTLVVAIIDPATNKPGIKLAIEGLREDGWYGLDKVVVGK